MTAITATATEAAVAAETETEPKRGPVGCLQRRHWALLLVLVGLLVGGCEADASETTSRATVGGGGLATTSSSLETTTATEPVDPGAVLANAYNATAGNYRFLSVVVVDAETLTTVSGIVDGSSVAATIQAGTTQVDYVRTPAGEWVTDAGGAWVPLAGEAPATAPLAGLVESTDLELEEQSAGRVVIGTTLGPGGGSAAGVRVSVVIEAGVVTEIRYQAETNGLIADVTTTVSDVGVAGSVAAPAG